MNERIKELVRQCWDHQINHLDAEKFAKLIIEECCDVVRYIDAVDIKKHFGIDE